MKPIPTLIEGRQEYVRELAGWQLQIISYQLGEKYVCIVNNLDPGATICRICGMNRKETLREALEQAQALLSQTVVTDAPKSTVHNAPLSRIIYDDKGSTVNQSVEEFLALPIQVRMQRILSGHIAYFDTQNQVIAAGEAMKMLSQASAILAVQ